MSTAAAGASPAHCICASLRKASRAITQLYDNALRPAGLRVTQFNILAEIHVTGGVTLAELAQRMLADQTTLTRNVSLLEKEGLVVRAPHRDARMKIVRLSSRGETAFRKAFPFWKAVQEETLASIGGSAQWFATRSQLETIIEAALTDDSK